MINIRKIICLWLILFCLPFSSFYTCLFLLMMMIFFTIVIIIIIMILIPIFFLYSYAHTDTIQHIMRSIQYRAQQEEHWQWWSISSAVPSSIPFLFSYLSLSRFASLSVRIFVSVLFIRRRLSIPFYIFFSSTFKQLLCCCYYFFYYFDHRFFFSEYISIKRK